ncbi:MAG: hypothetical protein GY813_07535 [Halieaceae bacterium]|nr:hypothetical protein [Halieaceae bacterium]
MEYIERHSFVIERKRGGPMQVLFRSYEHNGKMEYVNDSFDVEEMRDGVVTWRTKCFHGATNRLFDNEKKWRASMKHFAAKQSPMTDFG